jgi:sulfur carrier protein
LKLSINGKAIEANFVTLGAWVSSELANNTKGIAIAVNDCIIPSSKWSGFELQEGDKILVVQAAQGG